MPDIFDQLKPDDAQVKGDIFDHVAASGDAISANPISLRRLPQDFDYTAGKIFNLPTMALNLFRSPTNQIPEANTVIPPAFFQAIPGLFGATVDPSGLSKPGDEGAIAGFGKEIGQQAQGFATPGNAAIMPAASEEVVGSVLGRIIKAAIGSLMGNEARKQVPQMVQTLKDPNATGEQKGGSVAKVVGPAALAGTVVKEGMTGEPGMSADVKQQIARETSGLQFTKDVEDVNNRVPLNRRLPEQTQKTDQVTPRGTAAEIGELSPGEQREFHRSAQAEADIRPVVNTVAAGLEKEKTLQPQAKYLGRTWTKQDDGSWTTDNPPATIQRTYVKPGASQMDDAIIRELEKRPTKMPEQLSGQQQAIQDRLRIGEEPTRVSQQGKELVFREEWEKAKAKGLASPWPEGGTRSTMTPQQEKALGGLRQWVANQPKDEVQRLKQVLDTGKPKNRFQAEVKRAVDVKAGEQPGVAGTYYYPNRRTNPKAYRAYKAELKEINDKREQRWDSTTIKDYALGEINHGLDNDTFFTKVSDKPGNTRLNTEQLWRDLERVEKGKKTWFITDEVVNHIKKEHSEWLDLRRDFDLPFEEADKKHAYEMLIDYGYDGHDVEHWMNDWDAGRDIVRRDHPALADWIENRVFSEMDFSDDEPGATGSAPEDLTPNKKEVTTNAEKEKVQEKDVLGNAGRLEELKKLGDKATPEQAAERDALEKKSKEANSRAAWEKMGFKFPDKPAGSWEAVKKLANPVNKEHIERLGLKPGMNAGELMRNIEKQPAYFGHEEAALAGFLRGKFGKFLDKSEVRMEESKLMPPGSGRGAYEPGVHKVFMNVGEAGRVTGGLPRRAIHESAHAATLWQYKYPKTELQWKAAEDMENLNKQIVDKLPKRMREVFYLLKTEVDKEQQGKTSDYQGVMAKAAENGLDMKEWGKTLYALTSPHEFISGIFEMPEFRSYLDSVKAEGKSVFKRAIDAIKDLLGISRDTVLDRAFDNLIAVANEGEWGNRELFKMADIDKMPAIGYGDGPGVAGSAPRFVEEAFDDVKKEWQGFRNWWDRIDIKGSELPAMANRADNKGRIMARQTANDVLDRLAQAVGSKRDKLKVGGVERNALSMVIEAQEDKAKLTDMEKKLASSTSWFAGDAKRAIGYAQKYWDKLQPVAKFYEKVNKQLVQMENAHGIATLFRDGYVPHVQDLSDINAILFETGHGAGSGSPQRVRKYNTFADSIAAGVKPVSLDAVDLMEHRVSAGLRRINRSQMIDSIRQMTDPATGQPIIQALPVQVRADGSHVTATPPGYRSGYVGEQPVAILKGYKGLLENLTGASAFEEGDNEAWNALKKVSHTAKHVALMADLYHPVRLFAYATPLRTSLKNPLAMLEGYKQGLSVLEFNQSTINRMVARGEIDRAELPELNKKRAIAATAIKTGFNVGRIADNLYSDFTRMVPGVKQYNKWLFDSYQRGLMLETYAVEFERRKKMEPGKPDEEIGRTVSKELNTRFGNLGKESWVKSNTLQDLMRFFLLAPNWNEGILRSEIGAYTGVGKTAADAITKKRVITSALTRDAGYLFATIFLGNQLINYATRGQPTWKNNENQDGARISAWIPDSPMLGGQGKSDGYFLNPMALSAEMTHELVMRAEKDKSVVGAVDDVLNNKLSSLGNIARTVYERKNWQGEHLSDWELAKNVAAQAAVMPLQGKLVQEAVTGKEQSPGDQERSLFASGGVKMDPVRLDRGEQLSRVAGKKLEDMPIGERAKAAKKLPQSDYGAFKEASAERAVEHEMELAKQVRASIPPALGQWLDKNKLDIHGYRESITQDKVRVPLSDQEKKLEQTLVTKEFASRIAVLKRQVEEAGGEWTRDRLQKRLNTVLAAGRKRAMAELKSSINEKANPIGQPSQ